MSRSKPTDNTPNPCTRWMEWSGSSGVFTYYNKEKKETVDIGSKFTFILLDQLAVVKGWHDPSESGISSNEVRDTKAERLVVKAFKGGILAEGFYASMRDRIKSLGGHFTASLYCAFKSESGLALGCVHLKGSALNVWVEFAKEHRKDIYSKAITCTGFSEGKKGSIKFRVPNLKLTEISEATNAEASKIDSDILQPYLDGYFQRTRVEQVSTTAPAQSPISEEDIPVDRLNDIADEVATEVVGEDIPF